MSLYSPPKVDVTVLTNPRIINIAGDPRLLAIVGAGPTVRVITDEVVTRNAEGVPDQLSVYDTTTPRVVTISKIATRSDLSLSEPDAVAGRSLYTGSVTRGWTTSGSEGLLAWPTGADYTTSVADGLAPPPSNKYYVSYTVAVPSTQYLPQTFSTQQDLINMYGPADNVSGSITLAGGIAIANGAPAVVCVQVSGSVSAVNYYAAIDKLRKKNNVEEVVCVFPAGSLDSDLYDSVQTYLFQHCQVMNTRGRWRGMFYTIPSPRTDTVSGFDVIGDSSTSESYIGKSVAYRHEDVVLMAPSYVWTKDNDGNIIELDSSYLACAVGGMRSGLQSRATPLTGAKIKGLLIEEEKWDMFEMDNLGSNGVCVVQNISGVLTIRDAITTDPTSADTQEQSVISQKRNVERTLAESLFNTYTNKGLTINVNTPSAVESTTRSILSALKTAGEIYGFGTQDDPLSGEVKITATQDKVEPRRINVTCSIKYLYPLKWISVTVSTFV